MFVSLIVTLILVTSHVSARMSSKLSILFLSENIEKISSNLYFTTMFCQIMVKNKPLFCDSFTFMQSSLYKMWCFCGYFKKKVLLRNQYSLFLSKKVPTSEVTLCVSKPSFFQVVKMWLLLMWWPYPGEFDSLYLSI